MKKGVISVNSNAEKTIIAIKSKLSIRSIAQSVSSQEYISPLPIAW